MAIEQQPLNDLNRAIETYKKFVKEKDLDVGMAPRALDTAFDSFKNKLMANMSAWEKVQLARHPQRPYPQDYIHELFTDFLELHGDRHYADDMTILGGFAKFEDHPVMVIGTQKGRNLRQNIQFNFGSALPEGFRKALRLMKLADKAGVPIITFVDTPGAYPGIGSEERNVSESIAMNLREMFRLRVPVICVITGEGGSGGALSLAVGNRVLMMEYAYYSVITPEGCAAILWRDDDQSQAIPRAAAALHLTSQELLTLGVIDQIVPEPFGGAHNDPRKAIANLGEALHKVLREQMKLSPKRLLKQRYDRFRAIGKVSSRG